MKNQETLAVNEILEQIKDLEKHELSMSENMEYLCKTLMGTDEIDDCVKGLMKGVVSFTDAYEPCKAEKQKAKAGLFDALQNVLKDKNKDEQYQYMINILFALQATSIQNLEALSEKSYVDFTGEMENLRNSIDTLEEEEVTDELLGGLFDQIAEGIEACGVSSLVKILSEGDEKVMAIFAENTRTETVVAADWDDMKAKNYTALATWVAYQRGELTDLPDDMTAEQIGIMAAASVESSNVMADVAAGRTAWETAMDILSAIVFVAAATLLIATVGAVILSTLSLVFIAPTFVGSLVALGITALLFFGVEATAETVSDALVEFSEMVVIPVNWVKDACVKLFNFVKDSLGWGKNNMSSNFNTQMHSQQNTASI